MNKLHCCPVCMGIGQVSWDFYNLNPITSQTSTNTLPQTCKSCSGNGIVYVSDCVPQITKLQQEKRDE